MGSNSFSTTSFTKQEKNRKSTLIKKDIGFLIDMEERLKDGYINEAFTEVQWGSIINNY